MKYKVSTDFEGAGPPVWQWQDVLHMKPGDGFRDLVASRTDIPDGRYQLAVSVSEDEGRTFKRRRYIEREEKGVGRYHYPSVIQSRDGRVHVTYSYHVAGLPRAVPESAGMSSDRLDRIAPAFERFVTDGQLSGVITVVSGQTFREFLKERIFDPLGMSIPTSTSPTRSSTASP